MIIRIKTVLILPMEFYFLSECVESHGGNNQRFIL